MTSVSRRLALALAAVLAAVVVLVVPSGASAATQTPSCTDGVDQLW